MTKGANEEPKLYELNLQDIMVCVSGVTPLICNRFTEKNQKSIEGKQQHRASRRKEARNPEQEYQDAFYKSPDGQYVFPAIAFKKAMVSACRQDDMAMTQARGAFHVLGDMLPIKGSEPRMRADKVVHGRKTTSMAYRPEFLEWEIELRIRYNATYISAEQIINLLEKAGFSVGVGAWRPEKDGSFGMFEVKKD